MTGSCQLMTTIDGWPNVGPDLGSWSGGRVCVVEGALDARQHRVDLCCGGIVAAVVTLTGYAPSTAKTYEANRKQG